MARLRVVPRVDDHGGAKRIEFDVTMAPHQMAVVFDKAGLVATLPQRAGPAVSVVDLVHIKLAQRLHHPADSALPSSA